MFGFWFGLPENWFNQLVHSAISWTFSSDTDLWNLCSQFGLPCVVACGLCFAVAFCSGLFREKVAKEHRDSMIISLLSFPLKNNTVSSYHRFLLMPLVVLATAYAHQNSSINLLVISHTSWTSSVTFTFAILLVCGTFLCDHKISVHLLVYFLDKS